MKTIKLKTKSYKEKKGEHIYFSEIIIIISMSLLNNVLKIFCAYL